MSSVLVIGSSGEICRIVSKPVGRRSARPHGPRSRVAATPVMLRQYYVNARGLYRIFNTACYRFYRSNTAPPTTNSTPFATATSLPATPATTFADGTWYLSVSRFNGVLDSGFIPVGPAGETYIKLVVSGGANVTEPPQPPIDWQVEQTAGVVRVAGVYHDAADRRADQWALAYTTDGSTPAADAPDVTADVPEFGAAMLQYDLPVAAHGTTVKVRLQTRRNDGTDAAPSWSYSAGGEIATITIDTVGPDAPEGLVAWPGHLGLA